MSAESPSPDWVRLSHAANVTGLSEHLLMAGAASGQIPLRTLTIGAGNERHVTFVNAHDLTRWREASRSPTGTATPAPEPNSFAQTTTF